MSSGSMGYGKGKRHWPALIASLLLLSMIPIAIPQARASGLTPHAPIAINGDSGFTAANGVTGGKGTPSDPYIIQGWNITASSCCGPGPGISINSTHAHFTINNVYVSDYTIDIPSVRLTNVANGAIKDSDIRGYRLTTAIISSRNVVISNARSFLRMSIALSDGITIANDGIYRIEVSSSTHITMINNRFDGLPGCDLCVSNSSRVVISGNNFSGCDCISVSIGRSDHIQVLHNIIRGDSPLRVGESSFVGIFDNQIESFYDTLINLSSCSSVSVQRNQIRGNIGSSSNTMMRVNACERVDITRNIFAPPNPYHGSFDILTVTQSKNIAITANDLSNSTTAMNISDSSNMLIDENSIQSNAQGVVLNRSTNIQVFHNNFLHNTAQARDAGSTNSVWDNGYPSGGNYWSDYAGVDICRGPGQNICPHPDGIGDTPYAFNYNQDNFPLMQPVMIAV